MNRQGRWQVLRCARRISGGIRCASRWFDMGATGRTGVLRAMRIKVRFAVTVTTAALVALAGPAVGAPAPSSHHSLASVTAGRNVDTTGLRATADCTAVPANTVSLCSLVEYVSTRNAKVPYSPTYNGGLTPRDLQQAYALPPTKGGPGSGPTVAVVLAFDSPTLETNLAEYRSTFGLGTCSVANRCLSFVDHHPVDPTYEVADPTIPLWFTESALDVDAVSAACPTCKILVSRAHSSAWWDLDKAVENATKAGAKYISMSYATNAEFPSHSNDASTDIPAGHPKDDPARVPVFYNAPGVSYFGASGDNGDISGKTGLPQSSPTVLSVGGTTVKKRLS
jgi:subtilase family serine protease